VATLLTAALSIGFNAPSLRGWRGYGPLLRFGFKFQANWYTILAREQGLNIAIVVVAGVSALGIWTFTNRLFLLPALAFSSLYVVGFPAMSNLMARGEDPAPIIMRTVRRAAIAGVFIFPVFAAASPQLIPSLFGEKWSEAAHILPFICLSTLTLGSVAVAATSYLSAAGRPGIVALAASSMGVVWLVVTTPLLPSLGVTAVGVGNLSGALVEVAILSVATHRLAGVAPHRPLLAPLTVALVAGSIGWLLCVSGPSGFLIAVASAALTLVLCATGLWLVCRKDLLDTVRLALGVIPFSLPRLRRATAEAV
jgi:O-antigen/teichoic acid export membrane protein